MDWELAGKIAASIGTGLSLGIGILAWRRPVAPKGGGELSWTKRRRHRDLVAFQCLHCGAGGLAIIPPMNVGMHQCRRCGRRVEVSRADPPWIELRTEGVDLVRRKRASMSWLGLIERVHAVEENRPL